MWYIYINARVYSFNFYEFWLVVQIKIHSSNIFICKITSPNYIIIIVVYTDSVTWLMAKCKNS